MRIENGRKVIVSREEVASFNRGWPCSTLRDTRSYWFEFDANYDLVDTDVPEHDDGPASLAMSQDCCEALKEFHAGNTWRPSWSPYAD